TPAALALVAIAFPTSAAWARPLPLAFISSVDAAASVWLEPSSMSWAYRWLRLRNTASRGRSLVPATCTRTRLWRFVRFTFRSCRLIMRWPSRPCRPDRKRHTSELQSRSDLVCRLLLEDTALAELSPLSLHDALPI